MKRSALSTTPEFARQTPTGQAGLEGNRLAGDFLDTLLGNAHHHLSHFGELAFTSLRQEHWKQTMSTGTRRLDLEEVGDVTVAKFTDKKILDEGNIQIIGSQLFALIEQDGRQKIVLDFSNVEYLSSAALGKLITMDKKVKAAKGKLRLCCIRPDIYEVFAITKLNKLFDMKDTLEAALQGL
jgi:anti-sigma B factor antagonist